MPPPPSPPPLVARLSGSVQHATAESIASSAHTLLLTLDEGHYWHPDLTTPGSVASTALLSSLGSAEPQLEPRLASLATVAGTTPVQQPHGWNFAVAEIGVLSEAASSFHVRLSHDPTTSHELP